MSQSVIAERDFGVADQERFASASGDRNPLYMDAVAARRIMAGLPVVHSIHALLWGLDSLFRYMPPPTPVASIKAAFEKTIYVGDHVQAILVQRDGRPLRVELVVENIRVLRLDIALGNPGTGDATIAREPFLKPTEPLVTTFDELNLCQGHVPFLCTAEDVNQLFPAAAHALGAERVAALICSSFLVGMVCPGLHSIYKGLNLATRRSEDDCRGLNFSVAQSDARFRMATLAVSGGGWVGTLDTLERPAPATQATMVRLETSVVPGEFRGASALVIGGSRGLGELTAKILAAGGAHVTLSYAVGEADARRVQTEIATHGGRCDVMHYDIRANITEQLSELKSIPNQLYYMATPAIFRPKSSVFSQQRFQEFLSFYVMGFYDLCRELRTRGITDLSIFYPSSISIEIRPANMTEYTMAKAAGEILCIDMQASGSPFQILVRRLPRLPTDQTATTLEAETADAIEVMLPIIREVHAVRKASPQNH